MQLRRKEGPGGSDHRCIKGTSALFCQISLELLVFIREKKLAVINTTTNMHRVVNNAYIICIIEKVPQCRLSRIISLQRHCFYVD